ncbi:hypothetical protein FWF74_02235 [Candidatus Saccharibacteria bacterium]|nr:hypothetical protein [Candidatus Saccharibacteria bacterium]MCL1963050.1 hypothetical protein [Candidatus Saccharibacteria bacterium]
MEKRNFVVIHNNQSTRSEEFDKFVSNPLNQYCKETGDKVTYIHVKSNPDETIKFIAKGKEIKDGDTVLAAGGDGTLSTVLNGLLAGGQKVNLALLPLGQSNDAVGSFMTRETALDIVNHINSPAIDYRPIDLIINGKHFRYALHEWSIGHLANIGAWDDRVQRANKITGKKTNVPLEILKYYKQEATKKPDAGVPAYVDQDGIKHQFSVIAALLGRLGGLWFPRLDGKIVKNLYYGNDFAVVSANIKGKPFVDIPTIIGWTVRGLPAERRETAEFHFETPIRKISVMVDGEDFETKNIRDIKTRRVTSNIKLYMPKPAK